MGMLVVELDPAAAPELDEKQPTKNAAKTITNPNTTQAATAIPAIAAELRESTFPPLLLT